METEKQVEQYLRKEVSKRGALCLKMNPLANRGIPDRLVIMDGRMCFVELKKEKGVLSEAQKSFIKRLELKGHVVSVLYSKKDVDKFIKENFKDNEKENKNE